MSNYSHVIHTLLWKNSDLKKWFFISGLKVQAYVFHITNLDVSHSRDMAVDQVHHQRL